MCLTSLFIGKKKIIGRFQIFKYPSQQSEEPSFPYEHIHSKQNIAFSTEKQKYSD